MYEVDINLWAVLAAAAVSMVIGAVWYGAFAKPWMKLVGKTEKELRNSSNVGYLVAMVAALVTAYVMAHIVQYVGAIDVWEGVQVGFWVWLGFVATSMAMNYIFSLRPMKLYAIDVANFLVTYLAVGAILAGWQ